jgi:hypothetical protein
MAKGETIKVADANSDDDDGFMKATIASFDKIIHRVKSLLLDMRHEESSTSSLHSPTLSFPNPSH